MRSAAFITALCTLSLSILSLSPPSSLAEEKGFYSPVIFVDKENNLIFIADSGAVFGIEVSEAAKPHLDKLPVGTLVDFVVEIRAGRPPLLKSWKVPVGDTPCKYFDGKTCR